MDKVDVMFQTVTEELLGVVDRHFPDAPAELLPLLGKFVLERTQDGKHTLDKETLRDLAETREHQRNGAKLVEQFEAEVAPIEWDTHQVVTRAGEVIEDATYTRGVARRGSIDLPDELVAAVERNAQTYERPYLWSGSRIDDETRRTYSAVYSNAKGSTPEVTALLKRLNSQPVNTAAMDRIEAARALVETYADTKRAQQHTALDRFDQASGRALYYQTGKGCPRLFDRGLQSLTSEVRHVLFPGSVEYDIRSCGLVTAAYCFPVPSLAAVLESTTSIWTWLVEELDVAPSRTKLLKDLVQVISYGGGTEAQVEAIDALLKPTSKHYVASLTKAEALDVMAHLNNVTWVVDLKAAAEKRLMEIFQGAFKPGGYTLRMPIGPDIHVEAKRGTNSFTYKDAMRLASYQMQAYELALMLDAVVLALNAKALVLFSFDGLTIKQDDPALERRLQAAVVAAGKKLGIKAQLVRG